MGADDDRDTYGTAQRDAPVTRADFERAIRSLNMSDLDLRDAVLNLGARIVALTDEMTRRLDGVEPQPAPPNTPAPAPTTTVEGAIGQNIQDTLTQIHIDDARLRSRVSIDLGGSKYRTPSVDVPCDELIPICEARCCKLSFALSTEDLDEGLIRWDYGQPYLIRQRGSDGYCVHNNPSNHGCTVHEFRPRVCRAYDCRKDTRIWEDFENRIPAREKHMAYNERGGGSAFDLLERAKARAAAIQTEQLAISLTYADREPYVGPTPRREPPAPRESFPVNSEPNEP
jgi:Fe-S-cluster containining protein